MVVLTMGVTIGLGAVSFFMSYMLGRAEMAGGIAAGTGIAALEFCSTAALVATLLKSRSKVAWGALLGFKSLLVFGLVAVLILVLKASGIGFMIGFSGLVLGMVVAGIYSIRGSKEAG
jgi:hypothetical protein